jgi:glucokinase
MRIPRLLADIGGTNARFALEVAPDNIAAIAVLPCQDFPDISAALRSYFALEATRTLLPLPVQEAAIAIANPVAGDLIRMTNHHWEFSISALRAEFGFENLRVVNDFKALALSLPHLSAQQKLQVGGGQAQAGAALGLIGAGTGLGVSGLIPGPGGWQALDSEGGHVSFAPNNDCEIEIMRFAMRQYTHVSCERLMSGIGLDIVYAALVEIHGKQLPGLSPIEIINKGLARECAICEETLQRFCDMLGTAASNLALTLGAKGGIYIGGGIVPRLGDFFLQSGFRQRFEDKGRFSNYLQTIPTYLITADYPAFLGLSALLRQGW